MFLFVAQLEGFNFLVGVLKSPMVDIHTLKHAWLDAHPFVDLISMSGVTQPFDDAVNTKAEAVMREHGASRVRSTIGKYTHSADQFDDDPCLSPPPTEWDGVFDIAEEEPFSESDNNSSGENDYGSGSE